MVRRAATRRAPARAPGRWRPVDACRPTTPAAVGSANSVRHMMPRSFGPAPSAAPRHPRDFESEFDVAIHRCPRKQRVRLEDHTSIGAGADDDVVVHANLPGGGMVQTTDDRQQCRLAAARRTEEAHELAAARHGDVVEGVHGARPLWIATDGETTLETGSTTADGVGGTVMVGPTARWPAKPAQEQVADEADHAEDDEQREHRVESPGSVAPARCDRPGPPARRGPRRRPASATRPPG